MNRRNVYVCALLPKNCSRIDFFFVFGIVQTITLHKMFARKKLKTKSIYSKHNGGTIFACPLV